ncbi:uncharacterized protein LOC135203144 [Macrobrachium nipponense]|uniref:uncharacterized protein LOC135203144 n=1 Tax=Macrobrachium nipponense TaxID=159736 RepID=UPI0030C7E0AF
MGHSWVFSLILCTVFMCQGQSQACWRTPEEQEAMKNNTMQVGCHREPRETIVRLDVPKGYDKVNPSAVIAKRCSGLTCMRLDQECVATETTKRMIKAEASSMNMGMQKECVDIPVEDHVACACRCLKTQELCGKVKIFNKRMCSCDCPLERRKTCEIRMRDMPGTVMWDPNTCSCPCNEWMECGSGEHWSDEKCRCVEANSNEI